MWFKVYLIDSVQNMKFWIWEGGKLVVSEGSFRGGIYEFRGSSSSSSSSSSKWGLLPIVFSAYCASHRIEQKPSLEGLYFLQVLAFSVFISSRSEVTPLSVKGRPNQIVDSPNVCSSTLVATRWSGVAHQVV